VAQVVDELIQSDSYLNSLIEDGSGAAASLHDRGQRLLLTLPKEALEAYEQLRRVDARLLWDQSEGINTVLLEQILRSIPVPEYAARAALKLASIEFEKGHFSLVRHYLKIGHQHRKKLSKKARSRLLVISNIVRAYKSKIRPIRSDNRNKFTINGEIEIACDLNKKLVVAKDLSRKSLLWQYKLRSAAPVRFLCRDRALYLVSFNQISKLESKTGKLLWNRAINSKIFPLSERPHSFVSPDIQFVDNQLIIPLVRISKVFHYYLTSFDLENGKAVWQRELGTMRGAAPSQFSVAVSDNVLYAVTDDGLLSAVNARTGRFIWLRRYLKASEFRIYGQRPQTLATVAKDMRALKTDDHKLYFYNVKLHRFLVFNANDGKVIKSDKLPADRLVSSFDRDKLSWKKNNRLFAPSDPFITSAGVKIRGVRYHPASGRTIDIISFPDEAGIELDRALEKLRSFVRKQKRGQRN
jgi:hypothetical protein